MLAHHTVKEKGLKIMSTSIVSSFPIIVKGKKMNNEQDRFFLALFLVVAISVIAAVIYLTQIKDEPLPELESNPITVKEIIYEETSEIEVKEEPPILSDEDLMAVVVMAEAGNQDMLGKVAVATTILNRCDLWGLTVETVINQPNQYATKYHGTITEDCYRAVEIAQENRDLFPETMIFFRTKHYHSFGEPYEQIGDHYFSLTED